MNSMPESGFHRICHKLPQMFNPPWKPFCRDQSYQEYLLEKADLWGITSREIFDAHLSLYEWVMQVEGQTIDTIDLCDYVECVFSSPEARTLPLSLRELVIFMAETYGVQKVQQV